MTFKAKKSLFPGLSKAVISVIVVYQRVFSRDTGFLAHILGYGKKTCMFYPTCSEYTKEAIEKYGLRRGITLGMKRLVRCRPGAEPGVDLVP